MKLSKRLSKVASLINKTDVIADIGCDHGFILDYVLENKLANFVFGTDISKKSAQKTQDLLVSKGYKNFVTFQSDGFENYASPDRAKINTIIIAGMGGYEIISILKQIVADRYNFGKLTSLVLQPQNNVVHVRDFLVENGFTIIFDEMLKDAGKFYNILKVLVRENDKNQKLKKSERLFGLTNIKYPNPDFVEFIQNEIEKTKVILQNISPSNAKPFKYQLKTLEKQLTKTNKKISKASQIAL